MRVSGNNYQKDHPGLTLGMYIDSSMFIKIGTDD